MSRIISSGAPRREVNILTGSSDVDTLLASISASVSKIAPVKPLVIYVNMSLRFVSSLAI